VLLNDGKQRPKTSSEEVAAVRAELEALRAERAAEAKAAEERRAQETEERRAAWVQQQDIDLREIVASSGDKYEMIQAYNAYNRVHAVRDYVFKNGSEEHGWTPGKRLSLDKAAEVVENLIVEDIRAKALKSKKLGLTPAQAAAVQGTEARHVAGAKGGTTAPKAISNRTAGSTATPSEARAHLSEEDALALATATLSYKASR
jgi:hypothetical protein